MITTQTRPLTLATICVSLSSWASPVVLAQPDVVFYELQDVMLLPDISSPNAFIAEPMTGTLRWDFETGDFENGEGTMLGVGIPWFYLGPDFIQNTMDTGSVEYTLLGNFHDTGLDLTLHLNTPLSQTDPSTVDPVRSTFDIRSGIGQVGRKGHVISGWLALIDNPCTPDMNDDGLLDNGDITAFVAQYLGGELSADINGDSVLDNGDISAFVEAFLAGCP